MNEQDRDEIMAAKARDRLLRDTDPPMEQLDPEPWEGTVTSAHDHHAAQRNAWQDRVDKLEHELDYARHQLEAHAMTANALQEVLGAHGQGGNQRSRPVPMR